MREYLAELNPDHPPFDCVTVEYPGHMRSFAAPCVRDLIGLGEGWSAAIVTDGTQIRPGCTVIAIK
jgi:hypothetical protein